MEFAQLLSDGDSIAVAESCTGGLLALRLTDHAGDWFKGGVVAYAPEVKFALLGVPEGPVVTAETAQAMAVGVRELLGTTSALSTTGVAGPETLEDQPVGTVYIAAAHNGRTDVRRYRFAGDPDSVREQAVQAAVELLGELIRPPTV